MLSLLGGALHIWSFVTWVDKFCKFEAKKRVFFFFVALMLNFPAPTSERSRRVCKVPSAFANGLSQFAHLQL